MKKIYITFFFLTVLFLSTNIFAKEGKIQYKKENISNYFQGVVFSNQGINNQAFNYLKEVQSIKRDHSQFNTEFIRTLVLIEKFKEAFNFSKTIWNEEELFFEADLLLGLNSLLKKDYIAAEKYFERLNKISRSNLFFKNFVGNVMMSWVRASQGKKKESFEYLKKIPRNYNHLKTTQDIFLKCYFDTDTAQKSFKELVENKDYNFSRYNFFLINYFISKNEIKKAQRIIQESRKKHSSNLLLKQTEVFFSNNESAKIKGFFDCSNPKDSMAEFFYIMANLYSSEGDYKLSNFYLKISLFLNKKFKTNKALLAENFFYQGKNKESKKIYFSLKSLGSTYSWYASKNIASILIEEKGKKYAINSLKKDFDSLTETTFEHYYDLADFYKDNKYFRESIKYYSLALKNLKKDHFLVPKILDKRGTSFERLGDWENAEKDLMESLKILPEQAHVMNYLAYTWIDKGINLDKGLEMLKKAARLKEDDGYIIDSLGWAYYAKKNYVEAEFFLQKAVELLPNDPIINDHYADVLWMLNRDLQARYFWNYILQLNKIEKKLKDNLRKKLIFGISKQS